MAASGFAALAAARDGLGLWTSSGAGAVKRVDLTRAGEGREHEGAERRRGARGRWRRGAPAAAAAAAVAGDGIAGCGCGRKREH